MRKDTNRDLLQGTLDLLVLKTLSLEPMHGWAVSRRIQQVSAEGLSVNQGSLYPALYRLEKKGWIDSEMGSAGNNRQVKVYRLTRAGRKHLARERANWDGFIEAMTRVLDAR